MTPSTSSVLTCAYNDGLHSGQLRVATYDRGTWRARTVSSRPSVSDSPDLVVLGTSLLCFMQTPKDGGWLSGKRYVPAGDSWQDLTIEDVGMASTPGAVVYTPGGGGGPLFVFHAGRGDHHELHYTTSADGTRYQPDSGPYPGVAMHGGPAPVVYLGQLHVFYSSTSGQLMDLEFGTGRPPQPVGGSLQETPSAVVHRGSLYVFYQSSRGKDLLYSLYDGTTWTTDLTVPGVALSAAPSACVYNSDLYVLHRNGDDDTLMYTYLEEGRWQPDTPVVVDDKPEQSHRSPSVVAFAATA